MIEIIREEDYEHTKENVLPKDIKQIGKPDIGDRIYVEDRVYRYLHPYEEQPEKAAYVLLGRFENYTGRQCTFIEGAIRLEEMNFEGELPQWNDNTWGYIYKKLKKDYDNMVIVGWAMDIKGQLPNLTAKIEKLHQNHFGGVHQVLFLMDTLEREEAFYSSRNNRLYRRDGFYIYYGKGIAAIPEKPKEIVREEETLFLKTEEKTKRQEELDFQESIYFEESSRIEKETDAETEPFFLHHAAQKEGKYREQLAKQETKERLPAFSSSILLVAVVCALGFAAYQNHQKMSDMENALAKMNTMQVSTVEKETENADVVTIEQVEGKVEKQKETETANADAATDDTEQVSDVADSDNADISAANGNNAAGSATTADTSAANGSNAAGSEITASSAIAADTNTANSSNVTANDTAAESTDTAEAAAAAETQDYLKQGYYIVQKGDNMAGICRKIYQTTAMMDKLCKVNDIDNPDAIYAGQYLTLPN